MLSFCVHNHCAVCILFGNWANYSSKLFPRRICASAFGRVQVNYSNFPTPVIAVDTVYTYV